MRKLGIKGFKKDSRTLKAGRYMTALPPAPHSRSWTHRIRNFGMCLNDQLGDCTVAAGVHAIQIWSANALGQEITVPDNKTLSLYERWAGYNPHDPNSDNGAYELDILNDWRRDSLDGHALMAYASVNPADLNEVRQAINLFGGIYIGLNLPLSAQDQAIWYPVAGPEGDPGSWGGHAVFIPSYGPAGFTCITWGGLQSMTNGFWRKYVEEAYALLSPVFIRNDATAPSGFNLAALQSDLAQIR